VSALFAVNCDDFATFFFVFLSPTTHKDSFGDDLIFHYGFTLCKLLMQKYSETGVVVFLLTLCYGVKFFLFCFWFILFHHHHHQPINVPTAGAQAFLMDYPQGERAKTHHAGPSVDWWVVTTADTAVSKA
jgi:hypothetical protein